MKYGKKKQYRYSSKKRPYVYILWMAVLLCSVIAGFFLVRTYRISYLSVPRLSSIYADWENKDYNAVYQKTDQVLIKRPLDGTVLALHGFAAYYLFAEQTDMSLGMEYLTTSIVSLRKALYRVKKNHLPKVAYILGKAYYQQGYYYADLAVKYLDQAYEGGVDAGDLSEFRGMAASLLGDPEKALSAFTETLADNPSDFVLYAVAENYKKKGDAVNAKLYLFETIKKTTDVVLEVKCRNQLGFLFLEEQNTDDALKQFTIALEKNTNSVDAYYGLGLLYEMQGNLVRARHEWRHAIRLNPLHQKTRVKLKMK